MIFISYRRQDEPGYVGRLADGLAEKFGNEALFRDVDTLAAGSRWKSELDEALARASIVLAVIGRRWESSLLDNVARSGDEEPDYVRYELLQANKLNIPVIPVLLNEARLPSADTLSGQMPELAWLNELQAFNLRDGQNRWQNDVDALALNICAQTPLQLKKPAGFNRALPATLAALLLAALVALGLGLGLGGFPQQPGAVGTHASHLPLPLGQIAHDWHDGQGTRLLLQAEAGSEAEKILNNLEFPAATDNKGRLVSQYCSANQNCIDCSPSPAGSALADAQLVTIELRPGAAVNEKTMRTEDGSAIWPVQQHTMPWENIDRQSGHRTLYTCN